MKRNLFIITFFDVSAVVSLRLSCYADLNCNLCLSALFSDSDLYDNAEERRRSAHGELMLLEQ